MSQRERWILIAAVSVAGLFLFDQILLGPWLDEWSSVHDQIEAREQVLRDNQRLLLREEAVQKEWRELAARLTADEEETRNEKLYKAVGEFEKRAGVKTDDIQAAAQLRRGDFTEIPLEVSLTTDIEGLRNVLLEIKKAEELVRVARLTIRAHPFDRKRSDQIDLDLRVSTLEYNGSPPRRNGKKADGGAR